MVWKSKPEASAVLRQSSRSGQVMRCIELTAATMRMAVDVMQRAAEAAIDRCGGAAIGPAIPTRFGDHAGSTVHRPRFDGFRNRGEGCASHQGQYDAA